MPNIDRSYYKELLADLPVNKRAMAERFIVAIQEQKTTELANYVPVETYGETDHGDLEGLTDDDHAQYYNALRGDARYSRTTHTHPEEAGRSVAAIELDTTLTASHAIILASETITLTLPTGISGTVYDIKNVGTGVITIKPDDLETIDGGSTATISTQYECITIVSDGSDWYVI